MGLSFACGSVRSRSRQNPPARMRAGAERSGQSGHPGCGPARVTLLFLTGLRPSPTRHAVGHCRLEGKLTQGPAVRVADRHHSLRRWMLTATRRAYEQVRCAVVALWSERNQRYAAQTRPGKSNLTQESRFRRPSPLVQLVQHRRSSNWRRCLRCNRQDESDLTDGQRFGGSGMSGA